MVMPICQTIGHYIPEHRNLHSITCSSIPEDQVLKHYKHAKSTQSTKLHTSATYWYIWLQKIKVKLYAMFTLKV